MLYFDIFFLFKTFSLIYNNSFIFFNTADFINKYLLIIMISQK